MAVILEGARFAKVRWELSNGGDFSRYLDVLHVAVSRDRRLCVQRQRWPGEFRQPVERRRISSARHNIGTTSTKTAVFVDSLDADGVLFAHRRAVNSAIAKGFVLETISWILLEALAAGEGSRPADAGHRVRDECLVSIRDRVPFRGEQLIRVSDRNYYLGIVRCLLAWTLWPFRSQRIWRGGVGASPWCAAAMMGYGGQASGLVQLKSALDRYNPQWLGGWADHGGFDPLETRTEIGQIGRIKTRAEIAIRLKTENAAAPPLGICAKPAIAFTGRRCGTRGRQKQEFASVAESPPDSQSWPLLPGKTNQSTPKHRVLHARWKVGLLPFADRKRVAGEAAGIRGGKEHGWHRARTEDRGLVVFDARYGNSVRSSTPSSDDDEDVNVPDREKPSVGRKSSRICIWRIWIVQSCWKPSAIISERNLPTASGRTARESKTPTPPTLGGFCK